MRMPHHDWVNGRRFEWKKNVCVSLYSRSNGIAWTQCIKWKCVFWCCCCSWKHFYFKFRRTLRFTKCAERIFIRTMRRKYFRLSWAQELTKRVSLCMEDFCQAVGGIWINIHTISQCHAMSGIIFHSTYFISHSHSSNYNLNFTISLRKNEAICEPTRCRVFVAQHKRYSSIFATYRVSQSTQILPSLRLLFVRSLFLNLSADRPCDFEKLHLSTVINTHFMFEHLF